MRRSASWRPCSWAAMDASRWLTAASSRWRRSSSQCCNRNSRSSASSWARNCSMLEMCCRPNSSRANCTSMSFSDRTRRNSWLSRSACSSSERSLAANISRNSLSLAWNRFMSIWPSWYRRCASSCACCNFACAALSASKSSAKCCFPAATVSCRRCNSSCACCLLAKASRNSLLSALSRSASWLTRSCNRSNSSRARRSASLSAWSFSRSAWSCCVSACTFWCNCSACSLDSCSA
mmetsp:Transcript_32212/g.88973  ORF Transcript_32212/g.88973 Transcript_32212/m.88973 type:complete len:236 (+) Transcript_32212:161-868(+)